MKKLTALFLALLVSCALFANNDDKVKVGLDAEQPTYKIYSTNLDVGVQVGDAVALKAEYPHIFKEEMAPMDDETFKWGVTLALVLSTIGGDFTDDFSFRANLMFGVFGLYAITTQLFLLASINYIGLGTSFDDSSNNARLALGYLMVPVLFMYAITSSLKFGLGPYFAFLLNAKNKSDDFESDVKDFVSGFDFGIKVAFLYELSEQIALSIGYLHGLSNIADDDGDSSGFDQYNRAFMVAAYINLAALLNK